MSIISREAELKYPDDLPGLDPTPLRSGYMDGADREWTDAEITAAAEAALDMYQRLFLNTEYLMDHGADLELSIAREAIIAAWKAARSVAVKEEA